MSVAFPFFIAECLLDCISICVTVKGVSEAKGICPDGDSDGDDDK